MSTETKHTKERESQLEKLSGKTGYCTECERLGRQNKELREAGMAMLDADCEDAMFEASNLMEKAVATATSKRGGE
jgi:hypothetical protein